MNKISRGRSERKIKNRGKQNQETLQLFLYLAVERIMETQDLKS